MRRQKGIKESRRHGGSWTIVVSAAGLFFDSDNEWSMRLYAVLGLVFSVYVTIATYQCAKNCRSALKEC